MTIRTIFSGLAAVLVLALSGCHEPHNPLLGTWQHTDSKTGGMNGEVVRFTPSTMVIDGRRVTVVYQIRADKVRVSASKQAIIYDLVDENTITYQGPGEQTVTLKRLE